MRNQCFPALAAQNSHPNEDRMPSWPGTLIILDPQHLRTLSLSSNPTQTLNLRVTCGQFWPLLAGSDDFYFEVSVRNCHRASEMAPGGRHCPRAPPTASCQVAIPAAETQKWPEKGRKWPQMTRFRDFLVKYSFWPNLKPGNGSAGRF